MRRFPASQLLWSLVCLLVGAGHMQGQMFQNPRLVKTDVVPAVFSLADLNGDGMVDLIYDRSHLIGYDDDPSMLHALLADGKGGYTVGAVYSLPGGFSSACKSGDVNGDGKVDLVCSGYGYRNAVVVVPGQGDGTFGSAMIVPVPPLQGQLCNADYVSAIADLNNDGHPDLVVTCEVGGIAVPMLGDGTGHFTAAAPLYVSATRIQIADLNGDGKPDMLAQGLQLPQTQILLGKGDGSFDYGQSWPLYGKTQEANRDSLLADVDGDGHPDLIGGGLGVVRIYRGHADGSFDVAPTQILDFQQGISTEQLGLGVYLSPLAFQDVNGDGLGDLVALGYDGVVVFPGKGGMQFDAPRAFPEDESITYGNFGGQVLEDVNGDGLPDYVTLAPDGLHLSYGQKDGSFLSGKGYLAGRHVTGLALADFDEDGTADVVTAGDLQLYFSKGKGDGSFLDARALPAVSLPMSGSQTRGWASVTAGDVNGDGHKDLVAIGAAQDGKPELQVLLGHGDGSFDAPTPVQALDGTPNVAALDINGDGLEDFALTNAAGVSVLLQGKGGAYQSKDTSLVLPEGEYAGTPPTLGDLNGDGIPDLAYVTTTHAAVATGLGDGTFAAPVFYPLPLASNVASSSQGMVAIGDVDGDGIPDMAVTLTFSGPGNNDRGTQVFVLYGQGRKGLLDMDSFTAAVPGPVLDQVDAAVYVADVDGDGRGEVIADPTFGVGYPQAAALMRGRADRTLGDAVSFFDGYGDGQLAFADLNGDGRADLVSPQTYGNAFAVLLSVQPLQPKGTLTATPDPVPLGEAFTLTAAVMADGQSGPFKGKVTFFVDGKAAGSGSLVDGSLSIAGPAGLSLGDHQLTATTTILQDGQGSYAPITISGQETVSLLPVTVTLTSSTNPVIVGQGTTLTVQVQNAAGAPAGAAVPGGQVTLQADGVVLGSGGSAGSGALTFTLPYSGSAVGSHSLLVTYPGDGMHLPGTAGLQQVVVPVPGSFSVAASPTATRITPSQAAGVQITVTSVNGFFGPVALSVSGLPANVTGRLDTSTLMVPAGGSATAQLQFAEVATALQRGARIRNGSKAAIVAFASLLLTWLPRRRRRGWLAVASRVLFTCVGLCLSGCSGGHPGGGETTTTYTVTVTGTATMTGAQAAPQSVEIALTTVLTR